MTDTELTHWNKDTQGEGEFHRRDIVTLETVREDRIETDRYRKRIGQRGEVSAVFDKHKMCSVLFSDGYWLDLYFDEIKNTGEKGTRFCEIYYVPVPEWDTP